MKQPFEPKHIRRYLMLYGAVVVMMILFYLLTKALHTPQEHPPKQFENNTSDVMETLNKDQEKTEASAIRLLPEGY